MAIQGSHDTRRLTVPKINTHNMVCDFGRHKGVLYTRMPISYLRWMVNSNHSRKEIAEAELERRGTTMPEMEISGHAIDRASLCCRKIWHENREKDEGLHAWLLRIGKEALSKGIDNDGRCFYKGLKIVFEDDGIWPVMKTVMKHKGRMNNE
jgi:hypothetical protein